MARVNAKQPVSVDPAATYLEQLSKSALIDVIVDALRRDAGEEATIIREADAKRMVEPVLLMRGDKVPLSTEDQIDAARNKGASRMQFRVASRLAKQR